MLGKRGFMGWLVGAILTLTATELQAAKTPEEIAALRGQAESGNAEAQYQLAKCYGSGDGVPQDLRQVLYWCRKAAEQGHVEAQRNMGIACENGLVGLLQKDLQQAVYWYHSAAVQGNAVAQCALGECYNQGKGVQKDCRQAVYWYHKAAEQGEALAQYHLSSYYYSPALNYPIVQRVPSMSAIFCFCSSHGPNAPREAVEWLRKALSSQGNRDIILRLFYFDAALAFALGNQAYINTMAPVVREYDPMFDAHMREAVNHARRIVGGGMLQPRMMPPMPSSRGGVCPTCGGTGIDPTRIRPASYYGGAIREEYCGTCNRMAAPHSHYPCGTCHGLRTIR